jgi:hypothetical protein
VSRRGCLISLAIPVILLAGVGGWLAWQASDWSLPQIAQGMDSTFSKGDEQFKRRVRARYPIGSSEKRLLADLRAQGFVADIRPGDLSSADLHRFMGCGDKVWSVRWRATDDRITEVFGVYGAVCL